MSQKFRRSLLIFVLSVAATSSASPAATLEGRFTAGLEAIWSHLGAAFEPRLTARLKAGCSVDPDGNLICSPKHGCSIDPNGKPVCHQVKHGCSIDPNGKPVCTP